MTHGYSIQFCGNIEACRTEARIFSPAAKPDGALVAIVYESARGFVVSYFGTAMSNRALPGLDAAVVEARGELRHYINRKGENRPEGITRPGLALWLTERDDETVIGRPVE
jgi:hypothetical protein